MTTTEPTPAVDQVRTAVLGGEIASRYAGGLSTPVKIAWGIAIALALLALATLGWVGLVIALVLIPGTVVATLPLPGGSWAGHQTRRLHNWWRYRNGEHIFIGPTDPDFNNPDIDPGWSRPVPLGKVEPIDLTGTGLDDMFVLYHHNPGEANLFTLVLSVQGLAEGVRSNEVWAQNAKAFSDSVLNACARRTSHVRTLQMVSRAVPADLNPHERWITQRVRALDPDLAARLDEAIRSYGDVIDEIRPFAEDHRCYLVVGIGESAALMKQAARLARNKDASVEGGVAQVIRDEAANIQRALHAAGYGRVDVLGEQRACAVLRSMVNPSFPLDWHKGVRWENCWPSYVGGADALVVRPSGIGPDTTRWHTRIATVPPGKVAPVPLSPDWLAPLLTGVGPDEGDPADGIPPCPTIRTVTVRMDLVPADRARDVTRKHRTTDAAHAIEDARRGRIDDGGAEVMASASARRAEDLKEGSGYHLSLIHI